MEKPRKQITRGKFMNIISLAETGLICRLRLCKKLLRVFFWPSLLLAPEWNHFRFFLPIPPVLSPVHMDKTTDYYEIVQQQFNKSHFGA